MTRAAAAKIFALLHDNDPALQRPGFLLFGRMFCRW